MAERTQQIDTEVTEYLKGIRSTVYAIVFRTLNSENKPLTYGNVIDELTKIRFEWQRDTSDDSRGKALYVAVMTEEIERLEQKLAG